MNTAKDLFSKVLTRARDATKTKSGLFGLLSDNTITVTNLLFSAVVVGMQQLLSSEVFDCPLNNHVPYGVMFLVAPFVIVLMMNILLVGNVWKITDRCCVPLYKRKFEFCLYLTPNISKAFVGPFVWLIASFTDAKYFVCAVAGQDIEKRNLTDDMDIKKLQEEFANAKTWSHISAWIAFLVLVFGTVIVMTSKKCCLKDNVLLEDEYVLDRREAVAALLTFRHFIEHPNEHGDEETGPNKDLKVQRSGSTSSVSGAGTIKTSTAPVTESIPSPSDEGSASPGEPDHGGSATDITVLANDNEGNSRKNKAKDGTDGKQGKETLLRRMARWFTGDKKKDEKDEEQGIIRGRFLGKEEEITLYPEGIPEQTGKKFVEKLFEGWSRDDGSWHYHQAYEDFKDKYPRVTSGRPKDLWVVRDDNKGKNPKKGGPGYSRIDKDNEAMSHV